MDAKLVDNVFFKAETTVNIPTKAVIPMAIINMVSMVRSNCVRMDPMAILIFSEINVNILKSLRRNYAFCNKFGNEVVIFI